MMKVGRKIWRRVIQGWKMFRNSRNGRIEGLCHVGLQALMVAILMNGVGRVRGLVMTNFFRFTCLLSYSRADLRSLIQRWWWFFFSVGRLGGGWYGFRRWRTSNERVWFLTPIGFPHLQGVCRVSPGTVRVNIRVRFRLRSDEAWPSLIRWIKFLLMFRKSRRGACARIWRSWIGNWGWFRCT